MKNKLLVSALVLISTFSSAQNKNFKVGVISGAFIQHYNGNLGNSFFQFKTTAFGGWAPTFGIYINRSLDLNVGGAIGDFGYCSTDADQQRIVSDSQKCPGCKDILGMGELRSRMYSGNVALRYKFDNGCFLKEDSKLSPFIYVGAGVNYLSDIMKKNCVNVGTHFSVNAGIGFKYNINERLNIGCNVATGCFVFKKVYNSTSNESAEKDADDLKMEKRKDFYLQNTIFVGVNF